MNWLIVVPVWGDRYLRVFHEVTFPALRRAMEHVSNAKLIVYTDDPLNLQGVDVEYRSVPGPDRSFMSLSNAHRDAIRSAQLGDRLSLLTADLIVSSGSFTACEKRFERGYKLVCCAGMRVDEAYPPPSTESGSELLAWGWKHRHPMTIECTWPDGHSYDLSRMYFTDGEAVCCHLTLPHPFAFIKGKKPINFAPTIDVNVAANFMLDSICLITNPDEVAMIELSPRDKDFVLTQTMRARFDGNLASNPSFIFLGNDRHRRFFSRRIRICGNCTEDEEVVRRMTTRGG